VLKNWLDANLGKMQNWLDANLCKVQNCLDLGTFVWIWAKLRQKLEKLRQN